MQRFTTETASNNPIILREAVAALRKLGLVIPDDTTEQTFLPNVRVAALAVAHSGEDGEPAEEAPGTYLSTVRAGRLKSASVADEQARNSRLPARAEGQRSFGAAGANPPASPPPKPEPRPKDSRTINGEIGLALEASPAERKRLSAVAEEQARTVRLNPRSDK